MKTSWRRVGGAILAAALGLAPMVRGAAFSAELTEVRRGATRTGAFHFQDGSYRYEVVDEGGPVTIILDRAARVVRMVSAAERAYYEMPADGELAQYLDLFARFPALAAKHGVARQGTRVIAGVECTRQAVQANGQDLIVAWVAAGHDFPFRLESPMEERTLELGQVRAGPQDAALFAAPAGYKLLVPEEPKAPEWVAQVAGAPLVEPPFERTLAEGEIIRIRPQAGRQVALSFTHARGESSVFTAVGFKDGKPTSDPMGNTVNLNPDDNVQMTFDSQPGQADAIVVHTGRGAVKVKAVRAAAGAMRPGERPAPPASESRPAGDTAVGLQVAGSAEVAVRLEVRWSGPGNREDFIAIARPDQPPGSFVQRAAVTDGNPLRLWTPTDAGAYEVRYVTGRGAREILARAPLAVTAVSASVEPAGPAAVAAWLEVKWQGPAREGDYIAIARADQPANTNVGFALAKDGSPAKLRAPSDAGAHEVRYVLSRGAKVLARAPVTITPVTAEVRAPATAEAGADLEVAWQGPGYPEDYVALARPNQPAGTHVASLSVRKGSPLRLKAPKEPGDYEVRYLIGRGHRLLAKLPLKVTPPPAGRP